MQSKDSGVRIGMIVTLTAVKKTLEKFPEGMSPDQIDDMISEIEQQLGVKETEMEISKRA